MCRSQISLDQAPRLCHSSFSFYIFLKEQRIVEYLSPYSSIIQTLIFRYSIHQSWCNHISSVTSYQFLSRSRCWNLEMQMLNSPRPTASEQKMYTSGGKESKPGPLDSKQATVLKRTCVPRNLGKGYTLSVPKYSSFTRAKQLWQNIY